VFFKSNSTASESDETLEDRDRVACRFLFRLLTPWRLFNEGSRDEGAESPEPFDKESLFFLEANSPESVCWVVAMSAGVWAVALAPKSPTSVDTAVVLTAVAGESDSSIRCHCIGGCYLGGARLTVKGCLVFGVQTKVRQPENSVGRE
jgi:hypothetical protein